MLFSLILRGPSSEYARLPADRLRGPDLLEADTKDNYADRIAQLFSRNTRAL